MQFFDEQTQTALVVGIAFLLCVGAAVINYRVRRRWQREDEIELANACLRKERADGWTGKALGSERAES